MRDAENANLPTRKVVTAIICAGKLVQDADSEGLVPWWSFSKTVLAATALTLVRDEVLSLDERIRDKSYTLRQLLQHKAGIPNYTELDTYQIAVERGDTPWPAGEMLARVRANELLFAPGDGWNYSNTGYFLVRQIIEAATGQEIDEAIKQRVLTPLGVDGVLLARTAGEMAATEWGNSAHYDPRWVYHGNLIGRPAAAALILDRLMTGGLLPQYLLAQMREPFPLGRELPGRPWVNFGYGLGLMIAREGQAGSSYGHTGHNFDSVAAVYHFPDCVPPSTIAAFAGVSDQTLVEWAVHQKAVDISIVP